jgi:large subunit ribosomal protein L31
MYPDRGVTLHGGLNLKKDMHPEYKEVTFGCACGNVITTRSTGGDRKFDICSNCHPFYTGKQKLVDSAGRVDAYLKRYGKAKEGGK